MHTTRPPRVAAAAVAAIVLGGLFAACGDDTNSSGEPSVSLIIGTPFPEDHLVQREVLEDFAAEVSEATDGSVTIEFIPGGALGAGDVVYENVVSGAQDIGVALAGYTPGRFPLTEGLEQSFMFTRATQATATFWEAYEKFPELREEYADTKVLGLWTSDIGEIFTASKQVQTVDDMNGLSMRGPSEAQIQLINKLGGSGVVLPAADVFDSLDRGVIDGLMVAGSGPVSLNLQDEIDYILRCSCYTSAMFLTMNMDRWNDLSGTQQEAIDEITGNGQALSAEIAEVYDAAYDESIASLTDAGAELTELAEPEHERWVAAADEVTNQWIEDREADGLPGQLFHDFLVERAAATAS